MANYKKHIANSTTENITNPVNCTNADLSSSHSATLIFAKIACTGDCKINVDHAATLIIKNLTCKTLQLGDSYSSTLKIEGGSITTANGKVTYSSLGICKAKIGTDNVVAETSSTWNA